jgi:hypothetical protein
MGGRRLGHDSFAVSAAAPPGAHHGVIVPRPRIHRPPPAALVLALVSAGVSVDTAMAMDRWKAEEVLDLLSGALGGSRHGDEGAAPPAC